MVRRFGYDSKSGYVLTLGVSCQSQRAKPFSLVHGILGFHKGERHLIMVPMLLAVSLQSIASIDNLPTVGAKLVKQVYLVTTSAAIAVRRMSADPVGQPGLSRVVSMR